MKENISPDNNQCFVCGPNNPVGLKMDFKKGEDYEAVCEYIVPAEYQGYDGIVHGGIITTMIDEAMSKTIHFHDRVAVTAEIDVRFKKPLHINTPITVKANITQERGRFLQVSGSIIDKQHDQLIAVATAKFIAVNN